ncbi:hypothetical protein LX32DRAFT_283715 [Colletotrichum zoysiae]|uniref:Uncharacterized protein n=1 Tax=Colletotrichum zoysiae TaxID=1216348 RepID=A0AAD9HLB7_9PEZI|nr:hypothetical protein LX32DRAFT_283715 [Colletotrichum zoysiae]
MQAGRQGWVMTPTLVGWVGSFGHTVCGGMWGRNSLWQFYVRIQHSTVSTYLPTYLPCAVSRPRVGLPTTYIHAHPLVDLDINVIKPPPSAMLARSRKQLERDPEARLSRDGIGVVCSGHSYAGARQSRRNLRTCQSAEYHHHHLNGEQQGGRQGPGNPGLFP